MPQSQERFPYPPHLYDSIRRDALEDVVVALNGKNALADIRSRKGDGGPIGTHDYLNGLVLYIRSQNMFIDEWLTARNCTVARARIDVASMRLFDHPNQPIVVAETQNSAAVVAHKPGVTRRDVVLEKKGAWYFVHVGTDAVLTAAANGQTELDVWTVDCNGKRPQDFWVPISLMIGPVRDARHYWLWAPVMWLLLAFFFRRSRAARIAYRIRVTQEAGAKKLLGPMTPWVQNTTNLP